MPIYVYLCTTCEHVFERLLSLPTKEEAQWARCHACGELALRNYSTHTFSSPIIESKNGLAEDTEPFKAMHYHEKRGEWEKAAKAADGVSNYAKQKFIQKAEKR